jgi:hypothetical protein
MTGNRVEAMLRLMAASPSHLNVCLEHSVTMARLTAAQGNGLTNDLSARIPGLHRNPQLGTYWGAKAAKECKHKPSGA